MKNSIELFSYKSSIYGPLGGHTVGNIKMKFTAVFRVKIPYQKLKNIDRNF